MNCRERLQFIAAEAAGYACLGFSSYGAWLSSLAEKHGAFTIDDTLGL